MIFNLGNASDITVKKEKKGNIDLISPDVFLFLFLPRTLMLLPNVPANVPESISAADLIKGCGVFLPSPPSAAVKRGPAQSATLGSDGGASTVSSRSWRPGCPVHARTIPQDARRCFDL